MFKSTKGKLIFVIIFSIICITITALLIMYSKIDIEDQVEQETILNTQSIQTSNDEQGLDLKGKYNQNDLKIVGKQASQEKIEFSYFQIEGLKDKNIQEKIHNTNPKYYAVPKIECSFV